jgi:hypothetical protein
MTRYHLTPSDLKPGDLIADEPGASFYVATVELPTAPAVVATIRDEFGHVRYCGIEARLPVQRPYCPGSGGPSLTERTAAVPWVLANADHLGTCPVCGATCTGSDRTMAEHEASDRPADAQRLANLKWAASSTEMVGHLDASRFPR